MKNRKNINLTEWVIKLAETSGETISDVMEKLPSLGNDVKSAYNRARNKPQQLDLFEEDYKDFVERVKRETEQ